MARPEAWSSAAGAGRAIVRHVRRPRNAVIWLIVITGAVLGVIAGFVVAPGGHPTARSASGAQATRPNIIFVLTDDLTWNLVPYMPDVVAMEKSGTTFSNYFVSESLCCPSRSSLLTGEYPHNTGVTSNYPPTGGFALFHSRGDDQRTFATALQAAGYQTALMGKYLNGYAPKLSVDGQQPFIPPGWSEWDVAGGGYQGYNYRLTHNGTSHFYGDAPDDFLNTVLDRRAQDFVTSATAAGQPFLLEVAPFSPHSPATPAPADVDTFAGVRLPRPPSFDRLPTNPPSWLAGHPPLTATQIRTMRLAYERRVESAQSVDRIVADLQRTVAQLGESGNTYFVFSSDNGYHEGEHRLLPGKQTGFTTDVRVPLIVTGPDVSRGVTRDSVVQNVDVAPTFERLAGAAVPQPTDGRSFGPLLAGTPPADWPRLALVEQPNQPVADGAAARADPDRQPAASGLPPGFHEIISARFAYISYTDGEHEYYDLRNDPYELDNTFSSLGLRRRVLLNAELAALADCRGADSCEQARLSHKPG